MKKESLIILSCYAAIYIVWGSTYFFIKMAVETIPPFYVVGFRFLFGGVIFLLIALATGRLKTLPSLREAGAALLLGSLLLLGGNGLVTMAEQSVDSYVTALMIATTPIVIAFFNRVLFKMRVSIVRLAGILTGIVGVGLLLYDGRSVSTSFSAGVLMVYGGVLAWGFATSLGHRMDVPQDPFVNSGMQMLFAGVVSLAGVSAYREPLALLAPSFSRASVLGLLYLATLGSLAFSAYSYLLRHEPSIRIVSYSLVNPIIAVFLGLVIGDEQRVPYLFIGTPFILVGLFFMLYGDYLRDRFAGMRSPARA